MNCIYNKYVEVHFCKSIGKPTVSQDNNCKLVFVGACQKCFYTETTILHIQEKNLVKPDEYKVATFSRSVLVCSVQCVT